MRAVFRQLDGCAHAPACLRDGRRPASAAVRDVPDCTRAFRRDACKKKFRCPISWSGTPARPSFQWGRENSADGEKQRLLRRVSGQKKCRRTVRGKAKALRNGNFSAGGWGGRYWAAARGRRQSSGPFQSGKCRCRCADGSSAFLHRSRSVRPYLMQSAPDICPGRRCFYLKVVGQAAVLQKIKFGRVHGAEIQRDTENVR